MRAVGKVAKDLGLEAQGYRLLANMGEHSGQEVPHFHVHLFAGRPLGRMLRRSIQPPGGSGVSSSPGSSRARADRPRSPSACR